MRHRKKRLQFNRFTSWRKATLKSLVRSLFRYQRIKTTKIKALSAKPLADRLIGRAKGNTLTAKREAFRVLGDHKLVSLLFNDIAPRFNNKKSGFTRILSLAPRRGDCAALAILELTEIKKRELKHPVKKEAINEEIKPGLTKEKLTIEEKKPKEETKITVRPPVIKKTVPKKFLGGLRNIFKKERDAL